MKAIKRVRNKTLEWIQIGKFKREFELKSAEGLFGKLKWEKAFGSLASAVTTEGDWTFKRAGFLNPRVSVRIPGSDKDIAIFKPSWTGNGILEFDTGTRFKWENKNFFRTEWVFVDQNEMNVLSIKMKPGLLKTSARVEILRDVPEVSLLASLGMYLIILMRDDSAASTAAIASSY